MKLFFAGDVLIEKEYIGDLFDEKLKDTIADCDYKICNLEGPIVSENISPASKRGPNVYNSKITFDRLVEAGFNIYLLANNHIYDYGKKGLLDTIRTIKGRGLSCCGAGVNYESVYKELVIGEEKIAIINICEKQFGACVDGDVGFAWIFDKTVEKNIRRLKANGYIIIAAVHIGAENLNVPLPEVVRLYRYLCDIGVNVVLGGHTHCIQGYENYNDGEIYYNLGDLAFEYGEREETRSIGIVLEITNKKINSKVIPLKYKKNKVHIDDIDAYEKSCAMVHSNDYINVVNEYCINVYKQELKTYYAACIGLSIENEDLVEKFIMHRKNKDDIRFDELMIYHNIAIETNRWICERAIRLLNEAFNY